MPDEPIPDLASHVGQILEHLRKRRAELKAEESKANFHLGAIQGGLAELDLLIDDLMPKVNIIMLPPDGEEPSGNQQYDLGTLKIEDLAADN